MATGTLAEPSKHQASVQQVLAWGYYGWPDTQAALTMTRSAVSSVGEVRYVIGWEADQMSRMDWTVVVNGSATWTLRLPNGVTVTSNADTLVDDETHPRRASRTLLAEAINWTTSTVRQVTTNLFVAGQLDYVAIDDSWQVVSVVHPERNELLARASLVAPGIWPHPAYPDRPDAPLFGVLDVLEELVWLSRLARSQSRNRVGMRGILGVADGLNFDNGGEFWSEWDRAMSEPMADPDNVQPVILRGSAELVEPVREGMKGLAWVVPDLPYDDKVDVRITSAIQRLAYGLPTPPEILLGMQAQSRATAYQVDDSSYRAHIEPAADLVARVATTALGQVVDTQTSKVEVIPDPAAILARRRTVADTFEAFDRGAVSFDYLREVLAIPADAAPSAAEQAQVLGTGSPQSDTPTPEDPANVAADPPVNEEQAALLAGASQQATERARERIGAKVRTRDELRSRISREVPNEQVAQALGLDAVGLVQYGVPVPEVTAPAIEGLLRWWTQQISADETDSVEYLRAAIGDHIVTTLGEAIAPPLSREVCLKVASLAG